MSEEQFKYPPGITTTEKWGRAAALCGVPLSTRLVTLIQRDAIIAARREIEASYRAINSVPTPEQRAANNAAHKEKICRCVFAPWHQQTTYKYGGVRICGYCDRPIL